MQEQEPLKAREATRGDRPPSKRSPPLVRRRILLLVAAVAVCGGCALIYALMINGQTRGDGVKSAFTADAVAYMRRFGYLDEARSRSETLATEEAVVKALKLLQKYGAIKQTGVLDEATRKLMSTPRCGCADVLKSESTTGTRKKRYVLASNGWNKRHLKYFIANWPSYIGEEAVNEQMVRAFNVWGPYGRLRFSRVYRPNDADITIAFASGSHGDSYPFDGPGTILAHAFFPNNEEASNGGDIHFDNDEMWATNPNSTELNRGATDLFLVAVHELGHSLGLGHSSDRSSIMYPFLQNKYTLGQDDVYGMYELYIKRQVDGDIETPDVFPATPRPNHTTLARRPPTTTTPRSPPSITPDLCDGHYDAVAQLRGELFVFKGDFLWRLRRPGEVMPGYPVPLRRMFAQLPESVTHLDAVYERVDGTIILFSGDHFWAYNGVRFVENSPQPISRYGLPSQIDRIDGVMVWPKNEATYFFRKSYFWRYNATTSRVDPGYPREISRSWDGIPDEIDDVMTWTNGITYFFKGMYSYQIDNNRVTVARSDPAPQFWFGCD